MAQNYKNLNKWFIIFSLFSFIFFCNQTYTQITWFIFIGLCIVFFCMAIYDEPNFWFKLIINRKNCFFIMQPKHNYQILNETYSSTGVFSLCYTNWKHLKIRSKYFDSYTSAIYRNIYIKKNHIDIIFEIYCHIRTL